MHSIHLIGHIIHNYTITLIAIKKPSGDVEQLKISTNHFSTVHVHVSMTTIFIIIQYKYQMHASPAS